MVVEDTGAADKVIDLEIKNEDDTFWIEQKCDDMGNLGATPEGSDADGNYGMEE